MWLKTRTMIFACIAFGSVNDLSDDYTLKTEKKTINKERKLQKMYHYLSLGN